MKIVSKVNITKFDHRTISDNDAGEGSIHCACGKIYDFSLRLDKNMVSCDGFVYPACPSCDQTPYSETRRIDL